MRRWLTVLAVGLPLLAPILSLPGHATVAAKYDTTPEGNAKFLADYGQEPDVIKLNDGLMYKVIEKGDGRGTSPIARQDIVWVEYRGWMINGRVFDSTRPGEPRSFAAGGVIPGWTEALYKMKTGDTWQIVIPANLAYGDDGIPGAIPPGQTLIFLVKLEKVEYP